jgi:hypothetical protein
LAERYLRSAAANLAGVPTLATDYGAMLDDPSEWGAALVGFLRDVGVTADDWGPDAAVGTLDPSLYHERVPTAPDTDLPEGYRHAFSALLAMKGAHHPWRAPPLGPERAWTGEVLAMRREYDTLQRRHRGATASRAYRLASWLRGRDPQT